MLTSKAWTEARDEEVTTRAACIDQQIQHVIVLLSILKFRTRNVRGTAIIIWGKDNEKDRTKDKISIYYINIWLVLNVLIYLLPRSVSGTY